MRILEPSVVMVASCRSVNSYTVFCLCILSNDIILRFVDIYGYNLSLGVHSYAKNGLSITPKWNIAKAACYTYIRKRSGTWNFLVYI